jgi:ABC-type lipoprotein export system ATPase subunit
LVQFYAISSDIAYSTTKIDAKEGKTIVIVTHNAEIANKCPRQIIIKDGVVEE